MIIAIGGASTAGKTTLARALREFYHNRKVITLCQDDFVRSVESIPLIRDRVDWEHPASIDHQAFLNAILSESRENEIVIAEGLMVFWHEEICRIFDRNIFVRLDYNTFLRRKALDNRWGHEPEWYVQHIWSSFQAYGRPPQSDNLFILEGTKKIDLQKVIQYIDI